MSKRVSLFALLAAFALAVAACSTTEEDPTTTAVVEEPTETTEAMEEPTSVLDLAVEAGQFSTLIAAVEAAGLESTLQGAGPLTVFAPTDAAFAAAFDALGITAEDLLADTDTLTQILTYHVAPQAADSQLVATLDGQEVATVNGQGVAISVDSGQIMVNDAEVVSADLIADNGIVHVINGVLLPPDVAMQFDGGEAAMDEEPTIAGIVAELAAADDAEFTVLLAALEQAQLVDALDGADDELTVFAPTDEAFAAALDALGITADELLASEDLSSILLYHVAPGAFDAATVVDAAPIDALETLNPDGSTLSIEVVDGAVVINGTATVVTPDVTASNGVIHVIDAVLLP